MLKNLLNNKNLPEFGFITCNTRTSTNLMSNTKIYISLRNYPGGLPTGSIGGIGKGPKLPKGTSSGTGRFSYYNSGRF